MNVNTDTTVTTSEVVASGNAILYQADSIEVIIDDNIAVGTQGVSSAVLSSSLGSELVNNGFVFSAGAVGVSFQGDDSLITNNAGSTILGNTQGVVFGGDGATLNNQGTVSGLTTRGVLLQLFTDDIELNNGGEIFGFEQGIWTLSNNDGGVIHNSGKIHSEGQGLRIETNPGLTTVIDNVTGGLIRGGDAAIVTVTHGRMELDNRGRVDGDIDCNANTGNVNDVIVNPGKIIGDVFLGLGNDTFTGKGGGSSGDVFGEAGNDILIGGRARDTLDGGTGNDLIRGGRDKDSLFGGNDRDLFDFNSIKDSGLGAKRDIIEDFQRGNNINGDDIDLRTIDAKAGVAGNQKFKFIGKQDFHDKKGELRIEDKGAKVIVQGDVNGDGKADFEILVKVGTLSAGDFFL